MNVLRLIPEQGNEAITIAQGPMVVGRDPACDIHLKDASVSRQHAEIQRRNDGEWVIVDRKSANGVFVDGVRTPQSVLRPGQSLQIGNLRFRVEIDRGNDGSTLILGRSPLAAFSSETLLGEPPRDPGPAATPPAKRSGVVLVMALVVSGLAVMSFGLIGLYYYWSSRQTPPGVSASTPIPFPTPGETPTSSPVALAPVATPVAAPPKGALLISTDIRAEVWIDGRRSGTFPAGRLRRVEVLPGEHIVSFRVGEERHDQVVRANADEQAVVHLSGGATSAPPASPSPPLRQAHVSPAPATTRTATLSTPVPKAAPSPTLAPVPPAPPVVPPPSLPPAAVGAPNAELLSGTAAIARGDFFRALLVLKDVARRLEGDPKARKDLAKANAYLAWAYHGLNRPEEAQAAADRALKADPGVLAGLEGVPTEVAGLFRRRR